MYEDLSVNPDVSKRIFDGYLEKIPLKKPENAAPVQLDLHKIKSLFLMANIRDK